MIVKIQYVVGLIISLLPFSWIKLGFARKGLLPTRFYFSGRVAIYRLAQSLHDTRSFVMLPDYICNVLHRAFIEAGFEVVIFSTTEFHEPIIEDIKLLVKKTRRPTVLCLAPIMGADGGQRWITSSEGKRWREKNDVALIFDSCQDITRLSSPCFQSEKNFAIVSSFNDKSFPGVMGAVVSTDIDDYNFQGATISENLKVMRLLLFKFFSPLYKSLKKLFLFKKKSIYLDRMEKSSLFEYSHCAVFPYDISHYGATKIQVGVGLAGLIFHFLYLKRKKKYLNLNSYDIVKTPYFFTSPYVLLRSKGSKKFKSKRPYAIHGYPEKSLRPFLRANHFKGFMDFYES